MIAEFSHKHQSTVNIRDAHTLGLLNSSIPSFPPGRKDLLLIGKLYRLSEHWRKKPIVLILTDSGDSLKRFVPGMIGNGELSYMRRQ
jgi:hypothetical protein